jgi:Tol biopolymer transport system component
MTTGDFNDIVPSWSHDGRWIYFGSNRSGAWQIWKISSDGGTPQQVTKQGGFVASESYDGQWVYFAKSDAPGVWRIPVGGGDEKKILNQPRIGDWGYWTLSKNGIYFLDQATNPPSIMFATLDGEHLTKIRSLEHNPPPYAGLTVTPDERLLLFSDQVEAGSHITLVNGFR